MNKLAVVALLFVACGPKHTAPPPPDHTPPPDAAPPPTVPPDAAPPPKEAQQVFPQQTAQPQDLAFPDEAFRATQPAPTKARPFHQPAIKPFALADGVEVYLIEQHTLPIASIDLNLDGGSMTDPVGKEGLASVCMSMLTEGTEQLTKTEYAEALADVAASVDSYAGADTQGVSLSSLTKHLDAAFPLFVDAIRHPRFEQADFDRMIGRRLESLKQSKGSPDGIAARIGGPVQYGAAHPFGRIVTEASLKAITLDDCRAYHKKWLAPKKARLFVVGDLTRAQIEARWKTGFAGWKGTVPALKAPPAGKPMKARIVFVDVPGAEQSAVAVLHGGPTRKAKDYYAMSIMASVLGGGFASRINMNLREDKGYTYGARAGFGYNRYNGTFSGGGQIVSKATYQSLIELKKEIEDLHAGTRPVTADELEREKAGAVLSLPGKFANSSTSLGTYRSLVYFGLPLDYYAHYADQINKVTAKQVAAAAKQRLAPDQAIYVVVGDAQSLQIAHEGKTDAPLAKDGKQLTLIDALRALVADGTLGKGDLVVLDADGKPAP